MYFFPPRHTVLTCDNNVGHRQFGGDKASLIRLGKEGKSDFTKGVKPAGVIHLFIIY